MFTSFINFETFFVIAYRDRLIKIDLTNERDSAIVFQEKLDDQIINMSLVQGANYDIKLMVTTKNNSLHVVDYKFGEEDSPKTKIFPKLFGENSDNERIV